MVESDVTGCVDTCMLSAMVSDPLAAPFDRKVLASLRSHSVAKAHIFDVFTDPNRW